MSKNKTYTVKFRRKREGKTDYKKRIKYISSGKTRIVIRVSNNNIKVQGILRIDSEIEKEYYKMGGILNYVMSKILFIINSIIL